MDTELPAIAAQSVSIKVICVFFLELLFVINLFARSQLYKVYPVNDALCYGRIIKFHEAQTKCDQFVRKDC